jgi:retron-type reverse transcriptase
LTHQVLLGILRESFHDEPFIRLISDLLKAGSLEDWRFNATLSGTPQGGVVSPILSNIYLDRLDTYVERVLIPANTTGKIRRPNPTSGRWQSLESNWRRKGRREEARELKRHRRQIPTVDTTDPDFRRLRYVRYADDVRHLTHNEILLAEKGGSEEETFGSSHLPRGESRRGKEHVREAGDV